MQLSKKKTLKDNALYLESNGGEVIFCHYVLDHLILVFLSLSSPEISELQFTIGGTGSVAQGLLNKMQRMVRTDGESRGGSVRESSTAQQTQEA